MIKPSCESHDSERREHTFLVDTIGPVAVHGYDCTTTWASAAARSRQLGIPLAIKGNVPHKGSMCTAFNRTLGNMDELARSSAS